MQALLISAAHTCRHRELAGVQIEQRAMESGSMAGHVRAFQEGQRQHIEATRARPSPDPACAETTSSGLQTDHVQTAIHSRLAAVRVYPATSCFIPRPSPRLPASLRVRLADTQPRQHTRTASSAQRPSSAATQRPLDGGALLCRLALDTTTQSAAPVHHGSS